MLNKELEITLRKADEKQRKPKPDQNSLGFGKYFTDHMFVMDYSREEGWHDARIIPYGPLALSPAATVFHYGAKYSRGLKPTAVLTAECNSSAPSKTSAA